MKLNQNSLLTKLYCWFYVTDDLPQSLCPYFWQLVAMFILIVPYCIISLPVLIISIFNSDFRMGYGNEINNSWSRIGYGILFYFISFLLLTVLAPVIPLFIQVDHQSELCKFVWAMGVIDISAFVLTIVLVYGESIIDYFRDMFRSKNKPVKEKTANIVVEMVKAKYNKYCPKIEWVDNKNK